MHWKGVCTCRYVVLVHTFITKYTTLKTQFLNSIDILGVDTHGSKSLKIAQRVLTLELVMPCAKFLNTIFVYK